MIKRECVQCGKEFELSDAEIRFYEEQGYKLPTHCRRCRQANRIMRQDRIPNGRQRRAMQMRVIKAVPPTVLMVLIVAAFLLVSFVRGGTGGDTAENAAVSSSAVAAGSTDTYNGGSSSGGVQQAYLFRSDALLREHYEKHGRDMGYGSAEEYLAGANAVINNADALHKTEKEDGDDVYYVESTGDFVVVSTDGYLRTYFRPEDGRSYYDRQ